jgi:hypothetical protein
MRAKLPDEVERARVKSRGYMTPPGARYGAFEIDGPCGQRLTVIASDGTGWGDGDGLEGPPWEHVSVSLPSRCPNWPEMAHVKALFWEPEECVVQFHPPRSEYVNRMPYCLHLWRPLGFDIPTPPKRTLA